jgi:hypothetical protein
MIKPNPPNGRICAHSSVIARMSVDAFILAPPICEDTGLVVSLRVS